MSEPQKIPGSPARAEIPPDDDMGLDRKRLPVPGPWQEGVRVVHKKTRVEGQCRTVDMSVRQFRLVGETRMQWRSIDDWDPVVEASPEDIARDDAKRQLGDELGRLDEGQAALVMVLADDPDPIKALAKLRALRAIGALPSPPKLETTDTATARADAPKQGRK